MFAQSSKQNQTNSVTAPQSQQQPSQSIPLQRALTDANKSLTPSDILQLQRTIGNKATAQLLKSRLQSNQSKESSSDDGVANPIQRYTTENADPEHRISENKKIVRKNKKSLFASEDLISSANASLGEAKSYIRLEANTDREYMVDEDNSLPEVVLRWIPKEGDTSHQARLSEKNEAAENHQSFADCHRNAQTVMGSDQTEGSDTEKPVMSSIEDKQTIDPMPVSEARNLINAKTDSANRGAYAVFEAVLPRIIALYKQIAVEVPASLLPLNVPNGTVIVNKQVKQWTAYAKIMKDPILSLLFNILSGSNALVDPKVGDALTIISGTMAKSEFKSAETYKDLKARLGDEVLDTLHITEGDTFAQLWTKLEEIEDPAILGKLSETHMVAKLLQSADILNALTIKKTIIEQLTQPGSLNAVIAQLTKADLLLLLKNGIIDMGLTANEKRDATLDNVLEPATNVDVLAGAARSAATSTVKQPWNFHWAGVILKDGGDYVTLENLSVEDADFINDKWYYQMFGRLKKGQSFHDQYAGSGDFGNKALTLNYRNESD